MNQTTPIPTMKVRVGNRGNSRSYVGVWVTTVVIKKICPVCGGPRGDKHNGKIVEDGEHYCVDKWKNPCGHHDWYGDVLVEVGVHPHREPHVPRPVIFEISGEDGQPDTLHVYYVPQWLWHPRMTEGECEAVSPAPEIWAVPA